MSKSATSISYFQFRLCLHLFDSSLPLQTAGAWHSVAAAFLDPWGWAARVQHSPQSSCFPCRCNFSGSATAALHKWEESVEPGGRAVQQPGEVEGLLCLPRGKLRQNQPRVWLSMADPRCRSGSPVPSLCRLALLRFPRGWNCGWCFHRCRVRRDGFKSWRLPDLAVHAIPPPAELWINPIQILYKPTCCSP